MANAGTEMTRDFLLNIVRQVAILPLDDLQAVLDDAQASRAYWDSIGCMVDPTKYRNMLYDGTFDHAELQTKAVGHLVEIRKLIDAMDAIAAQHQTRKT